MSPVTLETNQTKVYQGNEELLLELQPEQEASSLDSVYTRFPLYVVEDQLSSVDAAMNCVHRRRFLLSSISDLLSWCCF